MENENTNQNSTPPTAPEEKKPHGVLVLAEVTDRIRNSGAAVREQVVTALVDKEINDRAGLIQKVLDMRKAAELDLRKASKADIETFDAEGKQSLAFSKDQVKARKDAQEKLDKIDKALDKALGDNDFSKLKELK